jgi:hypothetical protein
MAPKRAAIVGIRQITARKPSQLKKKAMTLEPRIHQKLNSKKNLQSHEKCTICPDIHI